MLWGVTGSGNRIREIIDIMKQLSEDDSLKVHVIISKAGQQMLMHYGLWEPLVSSFKKVSREVDANVPFVAGPLQVGYYDLFIVAPLTANSAAKIVYGIADTLITNAVAQTLKGDTPVLLYPVDQRPGTLETLAPDGMTYTIRTREVDVRNADLLKGMKGITIVSSPESLPDMIRTLVRRADYLR